MLTCQHLKSIPTIALTFFCIPDGSFRHGEAVPPPSKMEANIQSYALSHTRLRRNAIPP